MLIYYKNIYVYFLLKSFIIQYSYPKNTCDIIDLYELYIKFTFTLFI